MKTTSLTQLISLSVRRHWRSHLSSMLGIAIGVGALIFFVALGLGIRKVVSEKVFPVDQRLIEVTPAKLAFGSLLGGGVMDAQAMDRLRSLPHVKRIFRKMNVRVPAVSHYDGSFFGAHLRMGLEVLAVGVDADLLMADVPAEKFKDVLEGQPIPAVISSRLLEIYNQSFAPARGLPQLSKALVLDFIFPIEFNRSFVASTVAGPTTAAQLKVVGVSDRGMLAGITIPLATAQRLNAAAHMDSETFTGATLELENLQSVPQVVKQLRDMGFRVDDTEKKLAENAGALVLVVTLAMALLSALICLLAAFNIAHALAASVESRKKEFGVFRAVGATRSHLRILVYGEAMWMGSIGVVVALFGARLTGAMVDVAALRYLPPFPFKPEQFFCFPLWLYFGAGIVGIGAAMFGAVLPARKASQIDVVQILN